MHGSLPRHGRRSLEKTKRVGCQTSTPKEELKGIAGTLPIREVVMLPVYLQAMPSITSEPICNANEAGPN